MKLATGSYENSKSVFKLQNILLYVSLFKSVEFKKKRFSENVDDQFMLHTLKISDSYLNELIKLRETLVTTLNIV